MSAIGEYVHLTGLGYQKTGTNRQTKAPSIDAAAALRIQKNSIQNRIKAYQTMNDSSLKRLENQLNGLLASLGEDSNENKNEWPEQARKFLQKKMEEEFSQLQNIDFSTGSIQARNRNSKGVGIIRDNYKSYKNWRNVLVSRVNELNKYLLEMEAMTKQTTGADPNKYTQAIAKVSKLLNETYEKTWQKVSETGLPVKPKTAKNMIKQLNDIIKAYASMPAIQLQNGTFFERTIQLVPEIGNDLASKEVWDRIESYSKGQENVKVIIDKENFIPRSEKFGMGDIYQTIRTSQNKIDVAIEWEGQDLNISAKNLDLGSGYKFIHTTEGNSLLYMLQDENADFVNHYLNLTAFHTDGRKIQSLMGIKSDIEKAIKLTLAYKGLTGDTYERGNNITNVFIVNNYTAGVKTVKVISIANLLLKMENSPSNMISVHTKPFDIMATYQNQRVENNPMGTIRIASILQQMHARKVSTAFNSSLIGNWA